MYRVSIEENEGMLFKFPYDHQWKIWMLNMRFPIDTIWLDGRCKVVQIQRNMPPCKSVFSCRTYFPKKAARYVIEVRAGMTTTLKIKLGDSISAIATA